MLKLEFNECGQIVIVENDRGDWEAFEDNFGGQVLRGYDGENIIRIICTEMQDKSMDIVIIHQMCDSPSIVVQRRNKLGFDYRNYNQVLNGLLSEAYVNQGF